VEHGVAQHQALLEAAEDESRFDGVVILRVECVLARKIATRPIRMAIIGPAAPETGLRAWTLVSWAR
jgi:hypothetical protein